MRCKSRCTSERQRCQLVPNPPTNDLQTVTTLLLTRNSAIVHTGLAADVPLLQPLHAAAALYVGRQGDDERSAQRPGRDHQDLCFRPRSLNISDLQEEAGKVVARGPMLMTIRLSVMNNQEATTSQRRYEPALLHPHRCRLFAAPGLPSQHAPWPRCPFARR